LVRGRARVRRVDTAATGESEALGRPGNQGHLRHLGRHGHADAAQHHDPLGDQIHQFVLFAEMLVEQQVQLVESGPRQLPVVFLVQIAERDRVREQLVKILGARSACLLGEGDRHGHH
jgi:hypothetical protein